MVKRKIAVLITAILLTTLGLTLVQSRPAVAETGGYPYATYAGPGTNAAAFTWTDSNGNAISPYHYYYRNCVDFVAWKLATVNQWNPGLSMGNAEAWGDWASNPNHSYPMDMTPAVGAVAWWDSNAFGMSQYGHVAYVTSVNGDNVTVEEYNNPSGGNWSTRTFNKTNVSGYIHFSDLPPDSDQDGTSDTNDQCPSGPGAKWNFGCPAPRQKMVADFNEDGRADYAAFYNYQGAALWVWSGQANGQFTFAQKWYQSSGWDAERLIPAGAGDFNGDSHADIAAYYRFENAALALHVWLGDGQGNFTPPNTANPGWYYHRDWAGERIIPMGVGKFNADNYADVAAIYRFDGGLVHLFIWYGRADGRFEAPVSPWYSAAGWQGQRILPAGVGYVNNDAHLDLVAFYRHDNGALGMNTWKGNGSGGFTLMESWYAGGGWAGERIKPAGVGDFNLDGRTDVAAYFRSDGGVLTLKIWYAQLNGNLSVADSWSASQWEGNLLTTAGTGDFDGNGKQDTAAFYAYNGLRTWLWRGNGTATYGPMVSWEQLTGWVGTALVV